VAEHPGVTIEGDATAPPAPAPAREDVGELELALLLEGVRRLSGYDFTDYAVVPLKRRIAERVRTEQVSTVAGLLERVLHDPAALARLIDVVSTRSGELFGDVTLFAALRSYVVRWLRTFPSVRVWVVGSALDAMALAILFNEEGLARPYRIYATEPTPESADRARAATLDADLVWAAQRRYAEAGGRASLDDYLERSGGTVQICEEVRRSVVVSQHYLPTDGSFNEFQLVIAPHVAEALGPAAAYRAHRTIYQSLVLFGIVYFGAAAQIEPTPHARAYEQVASYDGLFRRIR
jgi:chemotaxis protein methyltransferase CheR